MSKGKASSWRLHRARFDVHDRFMGRDVEPFQHGGSSDNQKLLDAFNRGDEQHIRKWLTAKYWTEKEQGSPGYVGGIDLMVVLASWRRYPSLRPKIIKWLEWWAYLTRIFWNPRRRDVAMPAARSFMKYDTWADCYRMLVLGEKVRRRRSMKWAREHNSPTHLASEVCRELVGSRLPGHRYITPSGSGLKLKYPITRIEFTGGRSISYAAVESFNDYMMVVVDKNTTQPDSIERYGYGGTVKGTGRTLVREEIEGVYWSRGNKEGLVPWPRGERLRTEVIGG
jgi:hypothetical protein